MQCCQICTEFATCRVGASGIDSLLILGGLGMGIESPHRRHFSSHWSWASMEKLIFGVNSFLLKLNGTISRTETVFSRPSPIDKKHAMRLAPTIVNWLQTASTELGSAKSGHGPLVEVLRAAFESGETKGINRLGAEVDGALKILLTVSTHPGTSA